MAKPGVGSLRGGRVPELACPRQTIREVQPDVVVELCQYRVSMLKMDERTLLREAKEISLEKLRFLADRRELVIYEA